MIKLYQFYWDCGRQGNLDGLFVAEDKELQSAIGKELYFGEVLGKHSEVYGTLEDNDISVVSEDQEKIEWLVSILGTSISGFNPLEYIQEQELEDQE